MQVEIHKWGNSGAVRLPAAIMKLLDLRLGDHLDLKTEDGRVVLVPLRHEYRLDDLVRGITKENRHAVVDYGPSVGREVW